MHTQKGPQEALTHYNAALELLEWGRTGPWKDVPREDKGEIFELHWMRGLRRLRLEALRVVRACHPPPYFKLPSRLIYNLIQASSCKITDLTPQSPIAPLKALYEEAQIIIREMPEIGQAAFPGGHQDYGDVRGFVSAFGVYPKAYALA